MRQHFTRKLRPHINALADRFIELKASHKNDSDVKIYNAYVDEFIDNIKLILKIK